MVQRSPTMIVNVEPAQLYDRTYLGDGPPIDVRDVLNSGVPLEVTKAAHRLITDEVKAARRAAVGAAGAGGLPAGIRRGRHRLAAEIPDPRRRLLFQCRRSELIADGKIRLIQAADIIRFVADGLRLKDGSVLNADLVVLATGYKGIDHLLGALFGTEVAERVGRVWGFDDQTRSLPTCGSDRTARPVVHRRRVFAGPDL